MAEAKRPGITLGWTKARERRFLETLATSSNVAAAERVALVPPGSTWRRRQSSPAFCEAYDAALAEGYARLECALIERAIDGTPVAVTDRKGNLIEKREYSERLALTLLAAHRDRVAATGAIAADESAKERLTRKLEEMGRSLAVIERGAAGHDAVADADAGADDDAPKAGEAGQRDEVGE